MNDAFTTAGGADAPPEEALAIAYAPKVGDWLRAALALDRRLQDVASRPGDAMLGRLRVAWWSEAVATLGSGPEPVDPDLLRLAPLLAGRPDRVARVERLIAGWDERVGDASGGAPIALAQARADLLLDGPTEDAPRRALTGRALALLGAEGATQGLAEGLAVAWPTALRGHRLLAHAALHRLQGGSERALALKLFAWGLTGR